MITGMTGLPLAPRKPHITEVEAPVALLVTHELAFPSVVRAACHARTPSITLAVALAWS